MKKHEMVQSRVNGEIYVIIEFLYLTDYIDIKGKKIPFALLENKKGKRAVICHENLVPYEGKSFKPKNIRNGTMFLVKMAGPLYGKKFQVINIDENDIITFRSNMGLHFLNRSHVKVIR